MRFPTGKAGNTGRLGPYLRVPGSSAPPRMTSERSPASDHLARALDRAVYASLRPVLVSLTVLFCLFAIAHPLVLPAGVAMPMMVLAGSSSVIFLVLYGLLHAGRLPGERPEIYAVIVAALVLTNSLVHLHLVGEPARHDEPAAVHGRGGLSPALDAMAARLPGRHAGGLGPGRDRASAVRSVGALPLRARVGVGPVAARAHRPASGP